MNRFSRAREYSKPVSPFDMNFIGQAMAYKQNKVDANRALIQDTIDTIMSMDIAKPEAKQYLYTRVQDMVNNVNSYRDSDLSNDGVARNISAYINNAIDDTVLNAYAGTMEGRKLEQYYDRQMLEDPEHYNERNKAFALAPFYKWQQDGNPGSRLAPLQVSNYVDYNKQAQDVLKQMREAQKNGMEWQYPDPNDTGYMITKKIDKMTPAEVQQAIYNSMSPEARKQIYIDGWYMANTQPDSFTPEALSNYVSGINGDYDRNKAALRAQMAGAVGDSQRYDELRNSYDLLDEQRTAFNNQARQIFSSGNIEQMGAFMVENNFLRGMGQTWSYDKSSIKMENDPSYWNRMNYQQRLVEDQRNAAKIAVDLKLKETKISADIKAKERSLNIQEQLAAADMGLKQSQIELNAAKAAKLAKEGKGGGKTGANGLTDYSGLGVVTDAELSKMGDGITAEDYVQGRINQFSSSIKDNVTKILTDIKPADREALNAWIEEAKSSGDPEYTGLSNEDMVVAYFDKNGGAANEMLTNGNALDSYSNIKDFQVQMDKPMKVIKEFDAYQNDVLSEAEDVILNMDENRKFPYISSNGEIWRDRIGYLRGKEDFEQKKGRYLANMLGYEYLNEISGLSANARFDAQRTLGIDVDVRKAIDVEKASKPAMTNLLNKIAEYNGEHVNFEDVFVDTEGKGWAIKSEEEGEPYTVKMLRDLWEYKLKDDEQTSLGNALKGPLYGTISALREGDDPVKDLVKRATDPKVFADLANEYVQERTPKKMTVSKKAEDKDEKEFYDKLFGLYGAIGEADPYISSLSKFQKAKAKTPDSVSIMEDAMADGSIGYSIYINGDPSNRVPVPARTLAENGINIASDTFIKTKDLDLRKAKVNVGSNTNSVYSKHLINTGVGGIASKPEIMNTLLDSYPEIFRAPATDSTGVASYVPTPMGEEAIEMANGVDKFEVGAEGYTSNGVPGIKVYLYDASQKDEQKTPVYQYTLDGVEYANETLKRLSICPQYFVVKGYEMAIGTYKAGAARGTQAGKTDWDRMLKVVRKR